MTINNKTAINFVLLAGLIVVACLSGCSYFGFSSSRAQTQELIADKDHAQQAPGAVQYVWEEPMVDVVDVPPGLDPEGHYYRPAHQEVVEIRQGRYKYYKDK